MRRPRALLARFIPVAMLASLLALVGGSPANATTAWTAPVQLTGMSQAQETITRPNGDVVVGCSARSAANAITTVTASGGDGGSVARAVGQTIQACDGTTAVGSDGTVYAPVTSTPNPYAPWIQRYDLVANQGNTQRWSSELSTTCGNVWNFPSSVVMGNDGNVYIVAGSGGQCSTGTRLIGFNATDGTVLFNKPLGNSGSGRYNGLLPYSNGLVVWWGSQFRYFDYSGNEQTPVDITLGSGESVVDVAGGTGGTVFAMVTKNQSPTNNCPYGQVASRVLAFNGSGQTWQYSVLDCQQYLMFRSTPSNGVVFGGTNAAGVDQLTAVGSDGSPTWANPYKPDSGDDGVHVFIGSRHFNTFVDNNGNVVVLRWYHSEDNQYQGAQVSIVDGSTGSRRSVLYTNDIDPTKSFDVQPTNIGMSAGRLYVVATTCASGTCSSGDPYLYAIQVPVLGMDFPRAAALGQTSQSPTAELKYVAMGDSYASGEGVPPFEGASLDGCHRSTRAYARLLDTDPDRSIALQDFVACSGATTTDVINGKFGEGSQLNSLRTDTDLVTITIGGDDAGFKDFATACVTGSCSTTTTLDKVHNVLPNALDTLFTGIGGIKSKTGPNTRVLVVGYPRVVPDVGAVIDWPNCTYLQDGDDLASVRDVIAALNQELSAAVSRAGSQFAYVDPSGPSSPFNGHELCTNSSYFNGLNGDSAYAFHPNTRGQSAYEQVISAFLNNA